MSKDKNFDGVTDTEAFTEEDYEDFLDYLEDIEDLDDDDDDDSVDITDDDDDDDDSNETEVYDIIPTTKRNTNKGVHQIMNGVNFGISDKNGSNVSINKNGVSFNVSVDSIIDGFNSISKSITESRYRTMKRKLKEYKKSNKKKR